MVRWVTLNQLLIGRGRTLYARQFSVGSSPTPVITLVAWCFVRRLADPFLHGESLMSRVKGSNKVKHTFQAIGTIQITFDFKILYGKWKLESSKRSDCWGPLGTPGRSCFSRQFQRSRKFLWIAFRNVANDSPTVTRETPIRTCCGSLVAASLITAIDSNFDCSVGFPVWRV